jgi:hypothetical protein
MNDLQPLHRLFGLSWMDFFQGTDVDVQMEIDLSLKQQFLDVILIRKGRGPIPRPLPDGFDELAAHNLITFKSHHEALDDWALCELIGHYVNYRKQASPSLQELLPDDDFRLLAVCARFPQKLAQRVELTCLGAGVYDARGFALRIRIIVANQLAQTDNNAMLHLFSAREELLRFAQEHYRPHSPDTSSLLYNLLKAYTEEGDMPDKLKEFVRQTLDEIFATLPPEDLARRLPAEERLKGLTADEVIRALSPETRDAVARQLKANESADGTPPASERP